MPSKVPVTSADRAIAQSIEGESGGSSNYLDTRAPVSGRGFMVGQASDELLSGKDDPVYKRPANPQDIANFHATQSAAHTGDPNAAQGAWAINGEGYVMDVSRRIKGIDDTRTAGTAQLQQAAYALPGTRLGRGAARAGARGADVLLNMGAAKVPTEIPATTSERPVPQVLHHFGVNDSDARWNPVQLDVPGRGFTRYEAENRSWKVVGGAMSPKDEGGQVTGPPKPHTVGALLRGINERRTSMARNAYWHAHGVTPDVS